MDSTEDLIHLIADGFVCDTEGRGHATPGGCSLGELVVDASEGFIPLWHAGSMLRWRFQERSFALAPDPERSKEVVGELMSEALLRWSTAAPVKFTRDTDLWDFEIALRNSPECSPAGCVLASAFFPDGGRHQLTIYPTLFEQAREEQIETLIHELGHVFGLRHFFALVSETAWPARIFGTHNPFTIMNYGGKSTLTDTDLSDLKELYRLVWSGHLADINGTPIRLVRPFSSAGTLVWASADGARVSETAERRPGTAGVLSRSGEYV
jgi:hypothetical protein